jgi:serine/threonine protein kinase
LRDFSHEPIFSGSVLSSGNGAFGKVYEGLIQISNNESQEVAVKTTKENADQDAKDDFLKEAKAMSRLKHSHIVNMIGVCLDSDQVSNY